MPKWWAFADSFCQKSRAMKPEETVYTSGYVGINENLYVKKMQNGTKISERYIDRRQLSYIA